MIKAPTAFLILTIAIGASALYFHFENRAVKKSLDEMSGSLAALQANNDEFREQIDLALSRLERASATSHTALATCDTKFPSGLYRLSTSTSYGPSNLGDYEIYHVSATLAGWGINVGMRPNSFGIPTDFYFDYDGDGRIDTPLAVRFVREIPVAGNTIADRLLADSRVHQDLYSVFSCEWRNAEYTSSEDMNNSISGKSNMLWDLVQEHSDRIVEWIRAQ